MLQAVRDDLLLATRLNRVARGPSAWPSVPLTSRGLLILTVSRTGWACTAWRPAGAVARLLNRVVRLGVLVGTRTAELLSRSQIAAGAIVEGGVYLSGRGHVIIGARSIGSGTVIHDHVTIGRGARPEDNPDIGRRVWIGPNCVIYGNIRVGDGATVLPNTVLSMSVPDGAVVHGNPGRVLRRDYDNAPLRRTAAASCAALLEVAASK